MKLLDLEREESFALLGPGFADGRFLLLRGLRPACAFEADPLLVFAPFERAGASPLLFAAASAAACEPRLAHEPAPGHLEVELQAPAHSEKVRAIREAIARGDVYQVCLTARARLEGASGAGLLTAMCARGVPRFAAWVRLPGGGELVSASPELFFETRGAHVHTEPMKGTARPDDGGQLAASEKDRCELAMITDLLRNDLVPVCRPRSVRVEHERRVIPLPYALQTVSDVVGELTEGATALDVLAALHPGGSVTGAPKGAALAMIRQLEVGPRGAYCGALGLCRGRLRSTFSLLIRTAQRDEAGWTYGVGGGIVYGSDPDREMDELHVKLGALR
ncbi:MAG: chorismate-binding protein [Deltaproteobacteria bacterium]|nr:chorismate-binding protein [Deltaproteobacteria bacterium]